MRVQLRRRRTGIWRSAGQGSGAGSVQNAGRTIPDGSGDTFDEVEDGEDDDGDLTPEDRIKKLQNEAKRRRLQAKDWRKRAEAAEAKLGGDGQSSPGPDMSEVVLNLVEAGMSRDRIRAAMRLVDWSSVTDIDDAIEDLREEHSFLFESSQQRQHDDLPPQGSKGNGDRNQRGLKQPDNRTLMNKYPALRHGHGRAT